ncbi:MAG: transglycosylase domain-containing protein [Desulfitobacteriaceae bacterium]
MTTRSKSPKRIRRLSKWRLTQLIVLSLIVLSFTSLTIYILVAVGQTPTWDPASLYAQKQSSIVLDKSGNQFALLHSEENRQTVKFQDIPPLVLKTFIAVEDKRFYQHFGVDPIRIMGSAVHDILSRSAREGASTITVQLAKNAFIENPTAKKLSRKIQEVALAIQLEHEYTKDEILTFYLNKIFFGEASYGIRAAAKTYFGKELKDLNPGEIALLAGLPQAPTQYNPYLHPDSSKSRRNIVLSIMKDNGFISATEYNEYKDSPFTYVDDMKKNRSGAQKTTTVGVSYKFPYFVDYVIEELESTYNLTPDQIFSGGLKIYTTVDPKIQTAAENVFADSSNFPQGMPDMQVEGAFTLMDPSSGSVRAMVGGRNYTARGLNRAWYSKRQPGSSIKPLVVYGPAIEKGGYFPGTVLDDMPVKYNGGNGKTWAPKDDDGGWEGLIPMRYALALSRNVYAVKLLNKIGVEYGWKFAKERLGLPLNNKDKVLSLALGTTQVSTLDMASAYSVYANNGIRVTTHAIEKVLDSKGNIVITPKIIKERQVKETTAYLISDMLRGVVQWGTGTNAQIGNWAVCGKTGTTSLDPAKYGNKSGNPDAWFAGYTPYYAGVVWMGYDSDPDGKHYLPNVYGGTYPAKLWQKVMTVALADLPVVSQLTKPDGIVGGSYDTKSGLLPSSLTPSQFISSDIAAKGDFPTTVSDVWIQKEVDADHPTFLVGPDTENTITKVFLNATGRDSYTPWIASEAPYKIPTEYFNPNANTNPDANSNTTAAALSTPMTISAISTPSSDKIPVPSLGPVTYDDSSFKATIPLTCPPGSDNFSVILYIKRPDKTIDTYSSKVITAKSTSISVPLQSKGLQPPPGNYLFWSVLQDPATSTLGSHSNSVKLSLID